MKKTIANLYPLIAVPISLMLYLGCNKKDAFPYNNLTTDQALIGTARHYLENSLLPLAPAVADTMPYSRSSLHKTPVWANAYVGLFSFGRGVVVPLSIKEPLSVKINNGRVSLPVSKITWLLLYRDTILQWHAEVVTKIPAISGGFSDPLVPFVGKIRVEDWEGSFMKGYLYEKGTVQYLSESQTFRNTDRPSIQTFELAPPTPVIVDCDATDWYGCVSLGGGPSVCYYCYTIEECSASGSDGGDGGTDSPSASDYGSIGSGATTNGSSAKAQSIIPDTSITLHPIVNCVFAHLMSTQLTHGLKSILSSFDDSQVYNITFAVAPGMTSDGMTSYQGNNDFLVTLNQSEADDPDYSRIYLASTIIHEAFHAKLRQKALETFGETTIANWPKPIDDMTLSELASYFEADSKTANIWESVEHDWMVDNIAELATSLQDFVQTFYLSTYATVGDNLAAYEALMYMGLQNSTFYQEQVVQTGMDAEFTEYRRNLNEGGKCQD